MKHPVPSYILPVIVFAQFAGTSLWFAGNAIAGDLQQVFGLEPRSVGDLTSAVQFGFIAGTFVFALLSLSDRFSPSKVFLLSALAGAAANLALIVWAENLTGLLVFRFLAGFFLAGIYPVGMKISADWHEKGLGRALGYLVGALVLGTAFPHLVKASGANLEWKSILILISGLAAFGGMLLYFLVPDGPFRKPALRFDWRAIPRVFQAPDFRAAAFGYFGHMWELYAFWAFVPVLLSVYNRLNSEELAVPYWSFVIIAMGTLGCIAGGYRSQKRGSAKVAYYLLITSGLCCLFSPLFFHLPSWFFLAALMLWGFAVVGDSPQFSTIVARTAPADYVGTALTIVNCIGFGITIFSIQLLTNLSGRIPEEYLYLLLVPGPVVGLLAMRRSLSIKLVS